MTGGPAHDAAGTVVTVTLNPALDLTVWIAGFEAGAVNRVEREASTAGGKGVNVACRLGELDVPTVATGLLGVENAYPFESRLARSGVADQFVRRPGSTRTGIKIVDPVADRTTDVNFPGATLDPTDLAQVESVVAELAADAAWVVLAGSLPPGAPDDLYARLTHEAHRRGARVLVDTSGPALAAAVLAAPDVVKPNADELSGLVGRSLAGPGDVLAAALDLRRSGIDTVVVSMGADGSLWCDPTGEVRAGVVDVEVVSTVGAGDAMVAGIVASRRARRPLTDVAAVATACSALAISSIDGRLSWPAVEELASTVEVSEAAELQFSAAPIDAHRSTGEAEGEV